MSTKSIKLKLTLKQISDDYTGGAEALLNVIKNAGLELGYYKPSGKIKYYLYNSFLKDDVRYVCYSGDVDSINQIKSISISTEPLDLMPIKGAIPDTLTEVASLDIDFLEINDNIYEMPDNATISDYIEITFLNNDTENGENNGNNNSGNDGGEQNNDIPDGCIEVSGVLTLRLPKYAIPKNNRDARSYARIFPYTAELGETSAQVVYKRMDYQTMQISDVYSTENYYANVNLTYQSLLNNGVRFIINGNSYELVKIKSISSSDKNFELDLENNCLSSVGSGEVVAYVKELSDEIQELDEKHNNVILLFMPEENQLDLTNPSNGLLSYYRVQGGITKYFSGTKNETYKFQLYEDGNSSIKFTPESNIIYEPCYIGKFGLIERAFVSKISDMPYNTGTSTIIVEIQNDGRVWIGIASNNDNYTYYRSYYFLKSNLTV